MQVLYNVLKKAFEKNDNRVLVGTWRGFFNSLNRLVVEKQRDKHWQPYIPSEATMNLRSNYVGTMASQLLQICWVAIMHSIASLGALTGDANAKKTVAAKEPIFAIDFLLAQAVLRERSWNENLFPDKKLNDNRRVVVALVKAGFVQTYRALTAVLPGIVDIVFIPPGVTYEIVTDGLIAPAAVGHSAMLGFLLIKALLSTKLPKKNPKELSNYFDHYYNYCFRIAIGKRHGAPAVLNITRRCLLAGIAGPTLVYQFLFLTG
jgi:hypothetical protein